MLENIDVANLPYFRYSLPYNCTSKGMIRYEKRGVFCLNKMHWEYIFDGLANIAIYINF
jgi:hypothetical protein